MESWQSRYAEATPTSRALFERAARVLPAGVSYAIRDIAPYPFYVARAAGCRLTDVDGNIYTDYWSGHGALLLGHAPSCVALAVGAQLERGTHYGFAHVLEIELAELITAMVPAAEMVRFTNSGTEANMYAVGLARAHTGRVKIAKIEGGWHGNDTVWRMTLDLNRLLLYGNADGTLSDTPVRKIYSITDAVIAGEGEGPLAPRPVPIGILTFATSSAFADLVGASLMHFDWKKIPTVREAFGDFRYPLASQDPTACRVVCNGEEISVEEAGRLYGKDFHPSAGWRGHIEGKGSGK